MLTGPDDLALDLNRATGGEHHAFECGEEAVAGVLDDAALVTNHARLEETSTKLHRPGMRTIPVSFH